MLLVRVDLSSVFPVQGFVVVRELRVCEDETFSSILKAIEVWNGLLVEGEGTQADLSVDVSALDSSDCRCKKLAEG